MKIERVFLLLAVALLAGQNSAVAKDEVRYVAVGEKLDVRPSVTGEITNIVWKYRGDLLAEWVKGDKLIYYGNFKGRSDVNINTAALLIDNMTKADSGLYTVEINRDARDPRYDVKVIKEVSRAVVWIKPLSCSSASENCSLTCDGDVTGSEPVTYSWKMGDGQWKKSEKDVNITKGETANVKTFTCRIENPVSQNTSEPKDNPLFQVQRTDGPGDGLWGLVVIPIVVVASLAAAWKLGRLEPCISRCKGDSDAAPAGTVNQEPPPENNSDNKDKSAENVPLTGPNGEAPEAVKVDS